MSTIKLSMLVFLALFSTHVSAYGSSSSSKACAKPKFSEFTPAHLSTVAPQSEFSFTTPTSTRPESIEVKVKKQPVEVSINKTNTGYTVSGNLPDSLQKTYARINITATGSNNCKGSDGWLLKIEE